MAPFDHFGVQFLRFWSILGSRLPGPKWSQRRPEAQKEEAGPGRSDPPEFKLVHFGSILGSVLGSVLGFERAKMRQDDSNEDIKSLKVPRNIIFTKCGFTIGKPYFSRLGGSQEEYERFRKAPKRHLKSFKTSKERVPKMEPKQKQFLN